MDSLPENWSREELLVAYETIASALGEHSESSLTNLLSKIQHIRHEARSHPNLQLVIGEMKRENYALVEACVNAIAILEQEEFQELNPNSLVDKLTRAVQPHIQRLLSSVKATE